LYDELPEGAEILFPKSGPGYYGTRGTVAALKRLSRDPRFTPGTKGILYYEDKVGEGKGGKIKTYEGTSFIKKHITQSPIETSEAQDVKIQVLKDLAEKMNNKFDVSLRTSSHYFEWVGTGENRKLKLWHRLHDEIGSNFHVDKQDKKNWSNRIKELYSVVYHKGYSEEDQEGVKDIQALLDRLQNFYEDEHSNEQMLESIEGYIMYLKQEGDDISDKDLYECIKGIAEETSGEIGYRNKNNSLDRGTAMDVLCRTILPTNFPTSQAAIEHCKTLKMKNKYGEEVFVKDYFTEEAFEGAVKHLMDVRRVYVEELGYVLWTAPFTIYTEDFIGDNGNIRIAGEVDMLAIDKDGNVIIIDYKTSKNPFYIKGKLSSSFTSAGQGQTKSPQEQYTNQQSAYVQMLNETTRKETTIPGGFNCTEARLLPIHLIS
jgi:ATP-dependent exoDNAse (exonuclease V) beta subunit